MEVIVQNYMYHCHVGHSDIVLMWSVLMLHRCTHKNKGIKDSTVSTTKLHQVNNEILLPPIFFYPIYQKLINKVNCQIKITLSKKVLHENIRNQDKQTERRG
jgi:hypothetical protein